MDKLVKNDDKLFDKEDLKIIGTGLVVVGYFALIVLVTFILIKIGQAIF